MRPTRSSSIAAVAVLALAGACLFPASAHARSAVSLRIDWHGRLTTTGAVEFRVHVRCGPLSGSPDVRQGNASASQPRRGAVGEGGLSPDLVCDGVGRWYTANISSTTGTPFRQGLAVASASVNVCDAVGDGQVCANRSARRWIVVVGPRLPAPPAPPEPTIVS